MAEYTPNINLYKKDPVRDANDTFNIQTMLNENWDKIDWALGDTTTPAKKVGLTGDLSIGASLGVLATVGDLHVWRRTVSSPDGKPEVAAGYTMGEVRSGPVLSTNDQEAYFYVLYGSSISVSDDGKISLNEEERLGNYQIKSEYLVNDCNTYAKGKFCKFCKVGTSEPDTIYFIPSDATYSNNTSSLPFSLYSDKYQPVTGYPYQPAIPPGTVTVDYPVSVNPDAYQTGSDAQPAGYTLGDVQSGSFWFTQGSSDAKIYIGSSVAVSDDGTVSIDNIISSEPQYSYAGSSTAISLQEAVSGNFFMLERSASPTFSAGVVYFVPEGAQCTWFGTGSSHMTLSQYQPVTGYPAIPAGTTIEYLGKLGDKARIVTGSYVGTGTYGSSNPNTITYNKKPVIIYITSETKVVRLLAMYGQSYYLQLLQTTGAGHIEWYDDKVEWYNTVGNSYQLNELGVKYIYAMLFE